MVGHAGTVTVVFWQKGTGVAYATFHRPAGYVNDLREHHDKQIIVLIPVIIPDRLRYRLLHNHLDMILSTALRGRDDVIVARVPVVLHSAGRRAARRAYHDGS